MSVMRSHSDYTDAVNLFDESLREWESDGGEPLCIDKATRHRIWITFGGPSAYVDIFTNDGEVLGGTMSSTYTGDLVTVNLRDEESERVAQLFGLVD